MNNWLHALPIFWMVALGFNFTYLIAAVVFVVVSRLATGDRARSFKAVSAGILPPMGILFALFVAFVAAQVWNDNDRAIAAVDREASALRSVIILAGCFPQETQLQFRDLVRNQIQEAVTQEWPSMANRTETLTIIPQYLSAAVQLTLALHPETEGQKIAQREITAALETALDARRQRILISESEVGALKWVCLTLQALCTLAAIALVHSDNRLASVLVLWLYATGAATCLVLIGAYDRPFIGQLAVSPYPLRQVMPPEEHKGPAAKSSWECRPGLNALVRGRW